MKNKDIYIDLDDTLIDTQLLYNETNDDCVEIIVQNCSATKEEIKQKHNEVDMENVKAYGFSKERFPKSWCDVYEFFVGRYSKQLEEKANEVFNRVSPVIEGVEEVLKELSSRSNKLILLTAGDEEIQQGRIDVFQFKSYFEKILIVPMKTKDVMCEVVFDPDNSVMIGNSLKSDIFPALENGMMAIHVERGTWVYDNHEVDKLNSNYYHVKDIRDVLTIKQR